MAEIRALTSLRGLAAMAIVLQHSSVSAQLQSDRIIPSLVPHGYMAVDFFFTLSGFILCHTYLARFEAGVPGIYRVFLARRVARVLPMNVAAVLGTLALGLVYERLYGRNPWFNPYFLAPDLPANLLLLPGLGIGNPMIGPAWSVSVELVAYVGFPLLAALAFRADRTVRIALPALAALVLFSLTQLDTDHEGGRLADNLLRCLSEFSLGMTAFGIHRAGRLRWLATDEAAVLVAGGIMLSLLLGADPAASLLFPFLLIACAGNTGLAARALGTAVPYFLGEISYAIYMLHNTLREPSIRLFRLVHPDPLGIPAALGLALGMGLAVIPFAWVAHRAVERPCRAWGRRLLAAA